MLFHKSYRSVLGKLVKIVIKSFTQVSTNSIQKKYMALKKKKSQVTILDLFGGEEKTCFLILQLTWDSWFSSSATEKGLTLKKTFKGWYAYS